MKKSTDLIESIIDETKYLKEKNAYLSKTEDPEKKIEDLVIKEETEDYLENTLKLDSGALLDPQTHTHNWQAHVQQKVSQ